MLRTLEAVSLLVFKQWDVEQWSRLDLLVLGSLGFDLQFYGVFFCSVSLRYELD